MSMHVCTALVTVATGSWMGLNGWAGQRAHWVLGLGMESVVSRAATCRSVTMIRRTALKHEVEQYTEQYHVLKMRGNDLHGRCINNNNGYRFRVLHQVCLPGSHSKTVGAMRRETCIHAVVTA
jgi:hypothetical protein